MLGSTTAVGFLRKVKNPITTGTRIIRADRQSKTYPIVGENVCGVVTPLLVTSMGVPLAMRKPHIQLNKLAHPQASAVTIVAIMPRVLFCIFNLLMYDGYTTG